jgi:RNA polymerase sigma-70 factor (ECF subfamily)
VTDASFAARVVRAQLGDRAALNDVLRSVQDPLAAHITVILGEPDRADDVLQSVLLTIARRLNALNDPRLFHAWAYRIATREAVRAASVERQRALRHDEADEQLIDPSSTGTEDPRMEEIAGAVNRLPPGCGAVIRMHFVDGLKLAEIAEALELPMGTVKSRLAYGLGLLRRFVPRNA